MNSYSDNQVASAKDELLSQPRASSDVQISEDCFRAYGRIKVWQIRLNIRFYDEQERLD